MDRFVQLIPSDTQQKILIQALRDYSNKQEEEGNEEEMHLADEIRLEILKKRRG